MEYRNHIDFARKLDRDDSLASFRDEFLLPEQDGKRLIYFLGNSLGLQPKRAREFLDKELRKWHDLGVEGHFRGEYPWYEYHKYTKDILAELLGADKDEVVVMNNLTSNIHLLLVSFYRPSGSRYKIITEAGAFPSDQYALESQVRYHGYDPDDAIIEISPREGEHILRTDDIISVIEQHRDEACLVFMSGVQYYTGQFFDLKAITMAAHKNDMLSGFDLAHAVGNLPLMLNSCDVDFATWCGYKYLNGGPGGMSGIFVNKRYAEDTEIPRFAGWWGHDEEERFKMEKGFVPMKGADGWQLSNLNVLSTAVLWASLTLFRDAGILNLREKSVLLTGFLEFLLRDIPDYEKWFTILTPENPVARGCQLSLFFHQQGREVFDKLEENGIMVDWREPNVIRLAPVPLYNTYAEVYHFYEIMNSIIRHEEPT